VGRLWSISSTRSRATDDRPLTDPPTDPLGAPRECPSAVAGTPTPTYPPMTAIRHPMPSADTRRTPWTTPPMGRWRPGRAGGAVTSTDVTTHAFELPWARRATDHPPSLLQAARATRASDRIGVHSLIVDDRCDGGTAPPSGGSRGWSEGRRRRGSRTHSRGDVPVRGRTRDGVPGRGAMSDLDVNHWSSTSATVAHACVVVTHISRGRRSDRGCPLSVATADAGVAAGGVPGGDPLHETPTRDADFHVPTDSAALSATGRSRRATPGRTDPARL